MSFNPHPLQNQTIYYKGLTESMFNYNFLLKLTVISALLVSAHLETLLIYCNYYKVT